MRQRSWVLVALLVAVAAGLAGCRGETSDPSTVESHVPCGPFDLESGGVTGRVYHPRGVGLSDTRTAAGGSGTDCSASVYSPLVVIFHAAGTQAAYGLDTYNYLQEHLARNGFISVSLGVLAGQNDVPEQLAAAAEAWDYVEGFLWSTWSKRFYIDPSSIAVIGHSRGAVTARYLARHLEGDPVFRVRAVVNMATASGNDVLTGLHTDAYLVLYGTSDMDTAPAASFGRYDLSGSDDSQRDPGVNPPVIYKAFKLLEDAEHKGYSDLGSVAQQNVVKGYVLAFLERHNSGGATWYEEYIRGDAEPGGWPGAVFGQYSDGSYRRVIDHFDDGEVATATLGGSLTTFEATAEILDLGTMLGTYAHRAQALWTWGSSDLSAVSWSIPEGSRDASDFKFLSLRIGQASGDPANDLRIQLRNAGEWSAEVRLTDHGALAQPLEMCFIQQPPVCQPRTHMATIRVPLSAFGGHDDIDFVRLRFRGDSTVDTFIVDNLEFSEAVQGPWSSTI